MPRLYDLVSVKDDQIRTAFFFALRNTLVADDLKQATNIAFQVKLTIFHNVQSQKISILLPQKGLKSPGGRWGVLEQFKENV